jgi:hypothetical protein
MFRTKPGTDIADRLDMLRVLGSQSFASHWYQEAEMRRRESLWGRAEVLLAP